MSNFDFLQTQWSDLAKLGGFAEKYVFSDANSSIIKQGIIGENIVKYMLCYEGLSEQSLHDNTHVNRIRLLERVINVPAQISNILHVLRKTRNISAHDSSADQETESQNALDNLRSCFDLCVWFMQVYGDAGFTPAPYVQPAKKVTIVLKKRNDAAESAEYKELQKEQRELEEQNNRLQEKLNKILEENKAKDAQQKNERRKEAYKYAKRINLTEAQTRVLIDDQLSKCGWSVSTSDITYAKGCRPEKGKNKAIAEWPTNSDIKEGGGRADYALFVGEKMVGIVEAKRESTDVSSVLDYQCKDYAKNIKDEHKQYVIKRYGEYEVPFLYATNGRPYLKQIEEKSGIWFLDARETYNASKALQGWPTPDGLMQQLEKDIKAANEKLKNTSFADLESKEQGRVGLRKYQKEAIEAAEKAIADGKTEVLLAMATGTGKTRTVLAMIYRFLSAGRFKRILYLVDRHSLGEQTMDTFKELKLKDNYTLDGLYDIKELQDKEFEKDTKVHIATVQGLVKRLLYNDGEKMLGVNDYDLIIVDEAHRGYILDKQMSQDELLYRNQDDFQSKYRKVLDYFDAIKIGLTATPALHTIDIFGAPVYEFSYRQAVSDGFLADMDAPYIIKTELSQKGIKFEKGSTPQVYDPISHQITNTAYLEDELKFDVDKFNKNVLNESFNETVLTEVFKNIDPTEKSKTLVYAATDWHADLIVSFLKKYYEKQYVPNEAIVKITGKIENGDQGKIQEAIRRFKNEHYPTIVVTVDLLTTGIDVPQIVNLVFMRCVRSRILYEQMLGRATRKCDEIGKECFTVYDAVGIYEAMEELSNTKPVVQNLKTTFEDLVSGIIIIQDENKPDVQERLKNQVDLIKAKINRSSVRVSKEDAEQFERITKMPLSEFKRKLSESSTQEAVELILQAEHVHAFDFVRNESKPGTILISGETDTVVSSTHGYPESGKKPQDYLQEFHDFIAANSDKIAALKIIATRPSDLTRQDLKEIRFALSQEGFSETMLSTAWNDMTNQGITADIIAFIRQKSLDEPLASTHERIHAAIEKTKAAHPEFTKRHINFLADIEEEFVNEPILDKETFNSPAFIEDGGFKHINLIFGEKLLQIIKEINDNMYAA